MKRIICVFLVLTLALLACGCAKNDNIRIPVNFYYCTDPINYNSAEGVVSCEIRDATGYENNNVDLLSLYMQGPISDGFLSPFPANSQIIGISQTDDSVDISLTESFFQLTGSDQTLALTCLSLTVMDLYRCDNVQIRSEDGTCVELHRQDFLFLDDYNP